MPKPPKPLIGPRKLTADRELLVVFKDNQSAAGQRFELIVPVEDLKLDPDVFAAQYLAPIWGQARAHICKALPDAPWGKENACDSQVDP